MARKPKKAEASAQPKPSTQVSVLITQKQLETLLRNCKSINTQTAELTGSLREKIAYACEKQGLHKGAFAVARRLDKMEPEQALEFVTHLDAYMDLSGITDRIEAVGKLDLESADNPAGAHVGGRPANIESLADKRARRAAAAQAEDETESASA